MLTEKVSYKCNWCGKLHSSFANAAECVFKHARKNYANALLDGGCDLGYINWECGFNWDLPDKIKGVTKDNCFTFFHWQYCNRPAYQILAIMEDGRVHLNGRGSWSGCYNSSMIPSELPKPHPKEELFIYSEGR